MGSFLLLLSSRTDSQHLGTSQSPSFHGYMGRFVSITDPLQRGPSSACFSVSG